MPADVFIQTGERTFFTYLIRPVIDSFSRASASVEAFSIGSGWSTDCVRSATVVRFNTLMKAIDASTKHGLAGGGLPDKFSDGGETSLPVARALNPRTRIQTRHYWTPKPLGPLSI
jgi:hypothetical protein